MGNQVVFSGSESQKPLYLGFKLRHRSPQPMLRYKHFTRKVLPHCAAVLMDRFTFIWEARSGKISESLVWGVLNQGKYLGMPHSRVLSCLGVRLLSAGAEGCWEPAGFCSAAASRKFPGTNVMMNKLSTTGSFEGNCCLRESLLPYICQGSSVIRKE